MLFDTVNIEMSYVASLLTYIIGYFDGVVSARPMARRLRARRVQGGRVHHHVASISSAVPGVRGARGAEVGRPARGVAVAGPGRDHVRGAPGARRG